MVSQRIQVPNAQQQQHAPPPPTGAPRSPATPTFRPVSWELSSPPSPVVLGVLSAAVLFFGWMFLRRRKARLGLGGTKSAEGTPEAGSPAFERLVQYQEGIIRQRQQAGNTAYLKREYTDAAAHFQAATEEAVKLCSLHHPTLEIRPFALPLTADQQREIDDAWAKTAAEGGWREPTGAVTREYPPPGFFRTRANPALEQLTTPMLNNLAVYSSNRSACLLAMNMYDEALHDAELARHLQPLWSKGYLRAGQAYEGLGLLARAKSQYVYGARADPSDEAVAKCLRNLKQLEIEVEETRRQEKREEERQRRIEQARIASKASSSSTIATAPAEYDRFTALTSWLLSHGARFPYLYLKSYEHDHRGVHTLCRLQAGKNLLVIPKKCIMTSDLARASHIGRHIETFAASLTSNHTFLACFLLEERRKGAGSFWKPYVDVLPRDYANIPMFFTPPELALLEGSFTLGKIAEKRKELAAEYETVCRELEGKQWMEDASDVEKQDSEEQSTDGATLINRRSKKSTTAASSSSSSSTASPSFRSIHSLTDFIWARCVVITRVFGFSMLVPASSSSSSSHASGSSSPAPPPTTKEGVEMVSYKTDGLVPMADMLNHRRPRESSWNYDDELEGFVIQSLVSYAAGQEVCDSYGRKDNSRFFINYGFCLEENKDDNQAVIWVRLPESAQKEDDDSAIESSSSEAIELAEKKRRLLGLPSLSGILEGKPGGASQHVSASASCLSSSGYIYSPSDSASSSSFPPPSSVRFQIPFTHTDPVCQDIFGLMRIIAIGTDLHEPVDDIFSLLRRIAAPYDAAALARSEWERVETHRARMKSAQPGSSYSEDRALRTLPPLSLHNELGVLSLLRSAAKLSLAQFPTTREQDDEMIRREREEREREEKQAKIRRASSDGTAGSDAATTVPTTVAVSSLHRLTSNQRNCILMRRGEKEVLEHFVGLYAEVKELLAAYETQVVQSSSSSDSASSSSSSLSPADQRSLNNLPADISSRIHSYLPPPSPWSKFVLSYVEPRYNSGEGDFDYYASILLPLLQAEDVRRREARRT